MTRWPYSTGHGSWPATMPTGQLVDRNRLKAAA